MLTNRILIKSNLTPAQLNWIADNVKNVTFKYYLGWLINIIVHCILIGLLWQVFQENDEYLPPAETAMWGYSLMWIYLATSPMIFLFSKQNFRWVASVVNSPVWRTDKYILLIEDITQAILVAVVAVLSLAVDPAFLIIITMMYFMFIYYRIVAMDVLVKIYERNIPNISNRAFGE
jgi:hypothetical protein